MYVTNISFTTTYFILIASITKISLSFPDGVQKESDIKIETTTEEDNVRETPPECEPGHSCVSKCCPNGTAFASDYECQSTKHLNVLEWKPLAAGLSPNNYSMFFGFPLGNDDDDVCIMAEEGSFRLKKTGRIYYKKTKKAYPIKSYCIDYFYDENNSSSEFAVICIPIVRKTPFDKWADSIHRKGMLFTVCCIVVALMLIGSSPRKRDIHLNCVLLAFMSLAIAFLTTYLNMKSEVTEDIERGVCIFVGILVQYTFLSFYFWLNIIVFNLAYLIRSGGLLEEDSAAECNPRMKLYLLYAYGSPFVIACITLALQFVPYEASYFIKPRLAEGRCWFAEGSSMYAYFYGIEIFLHIINVALMVYSWSFLKKDEVKLHRFCQTFWFVLLFLVCWIMNTFTLISPHTTLSRVIDIFVAFQGVFIFLIIAHYQKYIFKDAKNSFVQWITCADKRRQRRP